ncbi:hypothetical protein PGTUg99_030210 [Puccinia graminis f. sp. tritici]|uniref:Uncharacterized protein n=1 Tax=Puccinia graminis f. sp. tritici TaxID=56615 RepID=A0A5B0SGM6_PUCGR|nr:hypothetical protein PGTUg99_030210 [Puccinia graminis f. sp. tritici]
MDPWINPENIAGGSETHDDLLTSAVPYNTYQNPNSLFSKEAKRKTRSKKSETVATPVPLETSINHGG